LVGRWGTYIRVSRWQSPDGPEDPWGPEANHQAPYEAPVRVPDRGTRLAALLVPAALVLAGVSGAAFALMIHHGPTPQGTLDDQAVYDRVEPSIVDVTSSLSYNAETAEGTGFVIDARDGLVLTNNHVIDGATSVTATVVSTGRTYTATVVGDDALDDVALLQIEGASGLTAAPIGNAQDAQLGAPVLGLGNSGGQGGAPTIAPGYISSLSRTIKAVDEASGFTETLRDMLQVTAQIQPGDSGGPLADSAGQVIGMDTAATQTAPGATGEGFAIPIGIALGDAGRISDAKPGPGITIGLPPFLGIEVNGRGLAYQGEQFLAGRTRQGTPPCMMISQQAAPPAEVAPGDSGVVVEGAYCGSPAATAGLAPGDVITTVDGETISDMSAFAQVMSTLHPDQRIALRWTVITGATRTADLTLGTGPAR
jgi:S1-C subfamily serine protease